MKEVYHQHLQQFSNNNGVSNKVSVANSNSSSSYAIGSSSSSISSSSNGSAYSVAKMQRKKELELAVRSANSLINVDSLLDGITALVFDCEPMRKNKNIDNFLGRCMILYLISHSRLHCANCFVFY